CEWELADLHLVSGFLGLGFCQSHAADLGLAVGAARDAVLVHRLSWLTRDPCNRHNAAHAGYVGKLRQSGNDVANRIDALFPRLHPLVYMDEPTLGFDARRLFQSGLLSIGPTAYGHQDLLRLQSLLLFPLGSEDHDHALFGLLYLL